jgi:hypothetical protein
MAEKDKKKSFFVETEDEKKQPKVYNQNEEVAESYTPTPNPKQPQTQTQPKTKKYKIILVASSYLVYDDGNKNGIFISGDFSKKYKIGDFIEI